jgi:alkylation response protein AidB-like acyl-CoA dehydrogenase
MDVNLTEDQLMLQDMSRRFFEDRSPVSAFRKLVDKGESFDPAIWREGAELGWVALFVPEAHGGIAEMSGGVIDAAVVAEEIGRVVYSGPWLSSFLAADAIARSGSEAQQAEWLPVLATGEKIAALAFAGPGVKDGISAGSVKASRQADGTIRLDGVAGWVEDAQLADMLLVTAGSAEGLSQVLVPAQAAGITVTALEALDLGKRIAEIRFDGVTVPASALLGEWGGAAAAFERQIQVAVALVCAETVGVTDRVFEFTMEWVMQRYAFNRPIGSYQALKHRLAEHATNLEAAKAAAAYAARAVQDNGSDAAIAVSIAKSHCTRSATEILRDCLQMHGGIGMTWEHDIHLYLRRAVSSEQLWGSPAVHHDRLCRLAGF